MKRLLIAMLLSGFAFAAAAQGNPPAEEPEEASSSLKAEARADAKADRFCIQQTGSRIVASRNARNRDDQKDCVAAGGRVYTRSDIERTGSTDMADALRKLDPSIN